MISGKIVEIRGITKEDAPLIYKWVNREDLRDLTGTLYPVSEYEHEKWIQSVTLSPDKKLFAVYSNEHCIGTIGIKNIDRVNSHAELFISLGETDTHMVGTDTISTFVDYCFEHLNFHKIYLHVFESNTRAVRCYKNAGFSIEGELKDHHFSQGKYETVFLMAKVRSF